VCKVKKKGFSDYTSEKGFVTYIKTKFYIDSDTFNADRDLRIPRVTVTKNLVGKES